MIVLEKNKSKEIYIENIVNDLKTMPQSYLKTMYAMVHVLKESVHNKSINEAFVENWANS